MPGWDKQDLITDGKPIQIGSYRYYFYKICYKRGENNLYRDKVVRKLVKPKKKIPLTQWDPKQMMIHNKIS